jgi:hypothetical protein
VTAEPERIERLPRRQARAFGQQDLEPPPCRSDAESLNG